MLNAVKDWIDRWRSASLMEGERDDSGTESSIDVKSVGDIGKDFAVNHFVERKPEVGFESGEAPQQTIGTCVEDPVLQGKALKREKRKRYRDVKVGPITAAAASSGQELSDYYDARIGSVLYCNKRGVQGRGRVMAPGKFMIFKGSIGQRCVTNSCPESVVRKREELLSEGVLKEQGKDLVFLSDCEFSSLSAAAKVLCGKSISGRTAWQEEKPGIEGGHCTREESPCVRDGHTSAGNADPEILYFEMDGVKATGRILPNNCLEVLQGSVGRFKQTSSCHKYFIEQHSALTAKGIAEVRGDELVFLGNHVFSSPSSAACVLSGIAMNGWKAWKDSRGVDLDNVIITYETKDGEPIRTVQADSRPTGAAPTAPPKPVLDPAVVERLTGVLSSHFSNGYRLNSPIEMARFRTFAAEDLDEEIDLTDEELKIYIAACGTTFDRKVYAVSAKVKERIKELVEDYFADGAQAIFFAEFYAKNQDWLFEASVVCEDMLIGILLRLFSKLSFTQTYFGYTDASVFSTLESEILRVWGDDVLLTYEQLAKRLQYIPLERIKYALGQNGDFIWSSVETFSHISRIDITDEERKAVREAAVRECNTCGYASIADLPFGEIEERNHALSVTAVHNAVYRICLSDGFDKKGKIITRQGEDLDAVTIMKEHCLSIEKCSLDDLLHFEKGLTGENHRWIPMEAANAVLVRVNKDAYVAERYVHFNADVIDEAIGLFVKGDYLPLKSFTTFGAFPNCGQTWNLFLLESYCRRFSRKFRFDAASVNSRNAGAVIRKSCSMDYTEIMTDAVAHADVPLKDTAVGKFLYESGYTGRSTNARITEIIDKAKAIRESGK